MKNLEQSMSIKPKLLCRYKLSPGGVFLTLDFPILELLPAAWSSCNQLKSYVSIEPLPFLMTLGHFKTQKLSRFQKCCTCRPQDDLK